MLSLVAEPMVSREVLVDAVLGAPVGLAEHKGTRANAGTGELPRRNPNRVQIGIPQTLDVVHAWPSREERLATEISEAAEEFDFYSVRLACSFVPGRGCRFVWARLTVALEVEGGARDPRHGAIALDLFPVQVGHEAKYTRSYAIKPVLRYAFAEVAAEARTETEVLRYEPTLTAAGLLTSSPCWTFSGLDRQGLIGSRELFMIVKKPKGAELEAHFEASAEVQTLLGRIPVYSELDPAAAAARFPLVPG